MLIKPENQDSINRDFCQQKATWVGVIGGMGTAAGIYFEQLFLEVCQRQLPHEDQCYPQWVYFNASQIPDRTKAIIGEEHDCTSALIDVLKKAQILEVLAVVVACNTAHYYYSKVIEKVSTPWVHLQYETARYIAMAFPDTRQVGVLATDGTLYAKLYDQAFSNIGIEALQLPLDSKVQQNVMDAIYDQKFGLKHTGGVASMQAQQLLREAIDKLNAPLVVAGCSELSMAFAQMNIGRPWVDPMKIAAKVLFDVCTGNRIPSSLLLNFGQG